MHAKKMGKNSDYSNDFTETKCFDFSNLKISRRKSASGRKASTSQSRKSRVLKLAKAQQITMRNREKRFDANMTIDNPSSKMTKESSLNKFSPLMKKRMKIRLRNKVEQTSSFQHSTFMSNNNASPENKNSGEDSKLLEDPSYKEYSTKFEISMTSNLSG